MIKILSFDTFFVLIDWWCIRRKNPVKNLKIQTQAVWSTDRSILREAGLSMHRSAGRGLCGKPRYAYQYIIHLERNQSMQSMYHSVGFKHGGRPRYCPAVLGHWKKLSYECITLLDLDIEENQGMLTCLMLLYLEEFFWGLELCTPACSVVIVLYFMNWGEWDLPRFGSRW